MAEVTRQLKWPK